MIINFGQAFCHPFAKVRAWLQLPGQWAYWFTEGCHVNMATLLYYQGWP